MENIRKCSIRSADGTFIYYEVYGEKNDSLPAFLIHGVGGDVEAWQFVMKQLVAAGFWCIAPDLRGHGHSGHPARASRYSLESFMQDFTSVLRAESVSKVLLVGHSLGAVLALKIAARFPETIERLVLIAGSATPPAYLSIPGVPLLARAAALASLPPIRPGHSTYPSGKFHKDFEIPGLIRTILRNSVRSYILSSMSILRGGLPVPLESIAMPTLILSGDADTVFSPTLSQEMHARIPRSELAVIPGGNHVLVLNNADEVSARAVEFLQRQ